MQALLSALIIAVTTEIVSGKAVSDHTLQINPPHQKHIAVGKDIEFSCVPSNGKVNITWFHPNGTQVLTVRESRIKQASNGVLQIKQALMNDSGVYTCFSENLQQNATVRLVIYVIPTYYMESMIIVGINCFLVGLFFLCYLYTMIYRRWSNKEKDEKENIKSQKRCGEKC